MVSPAFSDPSADIALRSSDGVLFKLQSYYLKAQSSIMREILSLPASDGSLSQPIQMEETAVALGLWLACLVPEATRPPLTLEQIDALMTLADKCVVSSALTRARAEASQALNRFDTPLIRSQVEISLNAIATQDAPSSFAVATIHGFNDAARAALKHFHGKREDRLVFWCCCTCLRAATQPGKCHRLPMERSLNHLRGLEAIPAHYLKRMPAAAFTQFSQLHSHYINQGLDGHHDGMWARLAGSWR